MVKGVNRRVVVVRPDERGLFEQAIFLVRDCAVPRSDVVREACRIADSYLAGRRQPGRTRVPRRRLALAFVCGALAASAVWTALVLLL